MFLGGAGAEYTRSLESMFSRKFVDRIIEDKQVTIKLDKDYLQRLEEYYLSLSNKTPKQLMAITKKYEGFK